MSDDGPGPVGGSGARRRPGWERPELPGTFGVEETAIRIGHYLWLERRIFELVGGWVAFVPFPEARTMLGRQCFHHSFHAEQWYRRLPELGSLTEERLVVSPGRPVEVFLETLGSPDPTELLDDARRPEVLAPVALDWLVGHYRVLLPHLVAAYSFHRNNVATITDAPTMRILDLCLADCLADWRDGELLVQSLLADRATVERAARHAGELSALVLDAGGVIGAGSAG